MSVKKKSLWDELQIGENEQKILESYIKFLSNGKTEREVWQQVSDWAGKTGFTELNEAVDFTPGRKLKSGVRGKAGCLVVAGKRPLEEGFRMIAAHIDSPRLDLKVRPLYEEEGMAYFKTHYYGGIKKYQWVALPLALHGVVALKSGKVVPVVIGEDDNDPVLTITDLLPHLGKDQREKTLAEGITGEGLNVLLGHRPLEGSDEDRVKENVTKILLDRYGIEADDFASAELEVVPAGKARYSGLDKSFIIGYGQDDRICAYGAWKALEVQEIPEWTNIVLLTDKEETGSQSNTGAQAHILENLVAELINLQTGESNELKVRRALSKAKALSADVSAGYDPIYADVYDKRNAAFMGQGISLTKYTGSRGKYDANEANAEFVAEVRRIFDTAGVGWQIEEMGKVDQGGGGTIAMYLAAYGMEVLDAGVSLLGMHSPWEVSSVVDIIAMIRGYQAFLAAE